jgi:membrane-associated protease RseP (regulator of RpoE activity)
VDLLTNKEIEEEEAGKGRLEFHFPILTLRTRIFTKVFDKLGSFRFSRLISWVALVVVPVVALFGLCMICSSLLALLWTPAAREIGRELGPGAYTLFPGINPYLPILYGWVAFFGSIAVHEVAHGVVARSLGLKVKSSGLLFFLFIPIGAFVDVDEKQIAEAKSRNSLRIMAAGVGANVAVALVCLLGVLLIVGGLTPIIAGAYIYGVEDGMPADEAGLFAGDVLVLVNNVEISSLEDLKAILEDKNPGDVLEVIVARGEMWSDRFSTSVNLTEFEGRAYLGVSLVDIINQEQLRSYQTLTPESFFIYLIPPAWVPSLVPFSDVLAPFYTHVLGEQWHIWANVFFWLWFFNVNIGIFNAIPIYPFDGGRIFNISLKSILGRRMGEKIVSRITYSVTFALICVLLMIAVIPFII